ncbi:hypothetical protein E8E12_005013 [Didymella heteroderae]|uniref:Peptide N-acetyl-beta-D-glucosaminyl asparaginase amidase A N-terminal domain-containing protein n=1 Tax=Didymella heteroderae TaxID=1769908 RepID=A0A9P4WJP8_9PLEO|nr:hypothetical protein E8E12_005013 [Didymella heteroderae]
MGGNLENVAGYGQLSLGQAVHIAQNSEGGVDQRLAQFLERRLADVWAKLNAQPTSYILPADEFALLNYYRPRFGDSSIVKDATKRFWDNHKGQYHPPDCEFNRRIFISTVTSAGNQFDRLALALSDDVEIFRTSMAEPTQDDMVWSFVKDVSSLTAPFGHPQRTIFDLGKLVDDT